MRVKLRGARRFLGFASQTLLHARAVVPQVYRRDRLITPQVFASREEITLTVAERSNNARGECADTLHLRGLLSRQTRNTRWVLRRLISILDGFAVRRSTPLSAQHQRPSGLVWLFQDVKEPTRSGRDRGAKMDGRPRDLRTESHCAAGDHSIGGGPISTKIFGHLRRCPFVYRLKKRGSHAERREEYDCRPRIIHS